MIRSSVNLRYPRSLAVTALVLLGAGCSEKAPVNEATPTPEPSAASAEAVMMEKGMGQLYQTGDPFGAAETFREVLKQNPTHYGAHFQLARALDRSGAPADARPMWEKVAQLADANKDTTTSATARTRLALPDTASQEAMMSVGVRLLYTAGDGAGAADVFNKVLERNPKHYGANFQLARALDKAGKSDEARKQWQQVLTMATAIKDQPTVDTARAKLATQP